MVAVVVRVGVLGTGVPRLACLRPTAWLCEGPVRPIFTSKDSRPSRGAKPRRADDTRPPQERPHQATSRGAERSRPGKPREVPMTSTMTIETRQAPGGRQRAHGPCFLFCGKEASAGEEYRGVKQRFPYRCNETKTSRTASRRSPWIPRRRHHQSLWQAKTTFVRISYTSCPLSNWPLWDPFPLDIWEEDRGLYK